MFELDNDGYPTDDTLENIKKWKGSFKELMEEIEFLFAQYGVCEYSDKKKTWKVCTGGWSGNESIIHAFCDHSNFWDSCWVSSRRGGIYEFDTSEQVK